MTLTINYDKLQISNIIKQFKIVIEQSNNLDALEIIRINLFGKNGFFKKQLANLHTMTLEEKSNFGMIINQAKFELENLIVHRKNILKSLDIKKTLDIIPIDVSLPGRRIEYGSLHPLSLTISYIEEYFNNIGFVVITGPEIEDNYHNFYALNIPENHPSYDKHDTFWFNKKYLLRTQTSGIQIRILKNYTPPIRIISYGRVYRKDNDLTHTPMFHQVEGLLIDTNINFSHLKGTLYTFLHNFFEQKVQIRSRPSYFPFTEPSAEIDIMRKNGKWLEILGCGMIHPKVLHNIGINTEKYVGFAFGMGIERLTMLRHGISDIRTFFENDLRFLRQFK